MDKEQQSWNFKTSLTPKLIPFPLHQYLPLKTFYGALVLQDVSRCSTELGFGQICLGNTGLNKVKVALFFVLFPLHDFMVKLMCKYALFCPQGILILQCTILLLKNHIIIQKYNLNNQATSI